MAYKGKGDRMASGRSGDAGVTFTSDHASKGVNMDDPLVQADFAMLPKDDFIVKYFDDGASETWYNFQTRLKTAKAWEPDAVPEMPVRGIDQQEVNIMPIGDVLLVKIISSERMSNGIVLPDTGQEKPSEATIISIGDGPNVQRYKPEQHIAFRPYAGTIWEYRNVSYLLLPLGDVLAVVHAR